MLLGDMGWFNHNAIADDCELDAQAAYDSPVVLQLCSSTVRFYEAASMGVLAARRATLLDRAYPYTTIDRGGSTW